MTQYFDSQVRALSVYASNMTFYVSADVDCDRVKQIKM